MADFLCDRIIGVLVCNTKHLLTSRRARCRWLLRHCIDDATRANIRKRIARNATRPLLALDDGVGGSLH